jgi:VanZ family protein
VKKLAHLVEYGILALACFLALAGSLKRWSFPAARTAWILSFLYAVSDEVHQYFIPTRSARVFDVGVDCIGAFLALWVLHRVLRQNDRK